VVQDEDGKPIEGATILPDGFRVKGIHGADAYGWNKKLFGPPETPNASALLSMVRTSGSDVIFYFHNFVLSFFTSTLIKTRLGGCNDFITTF
jgi:hypothetical protein